MQVPWTRLAVLLVAVSVAVAGCGKYSISNIRSLKAFQDANNLYKKGEFSKAVTRYEDSIRLNPELGFAYFFLGNSYDNMYKPSKGDDPQNKANLQKAAENYRLAVDKLAGASDAKEIEIRKLAFEFLIAAYGAEKLDDFSKAEPIAKELIAMDPNEPGPYQLLGRLYEDQGRYDEAEPMFLKAVELRPTDGNGYQILAGFYNRQGQFDKTMAAFNKRAASEPNNPEAWHIIGVYYFDKVHRDKSVPKATALDYVLKGIEAEDKALKLNSEYYEATTYKNILLRQQANLISDPVKQKQLIQEADVLRAKATELQKKQNTGVPAGRGGD